MTGSPTNTPLDKADAHARLRRIAEAATPSPHGERLMPLPDTAIDHYISVIVGKPKAGENGWEKYAEKFQLIRQWYDARPPISVISGASGTGKGRVLAVMAASLKAEEYGVYYYGETAAARDSLKKALGTIEAAHLASPQDLDSEDCAILVLDEYTQLNPAYLMSIATAL